MFIPMYTMVQYATLTRYNVLVSQSLYTASIHGCPSISPHKNGWCIHYDHNVLGNNHLIKTSERNIHSQNHCAILLRMQCNVCTIQNTKRLPDHWKTCWLICTLQANTHHSHHCYTVFTTTRIRWKQIIFEHVIFHIVLKILTTFKSCKTNPWFWFNLPWFISQL